MKAYIVLFVLSFSTVALAFPIVAPTKVDGFRNQATATISTSSPTAEGIAPMTSAPIQETPNVEDSEEFSRTVYFYSKYRDNLWNDRLPGAHDLPSLFKPPEPRAVIRLVGRVTKGAGHVMKIRGYTRIVTLD